MVKPSSCLWIKQVLWLTRKNQGLLFGLATYIQWGFLSLFWKLLAGVSAYSTFSWRIVFTVVTMLTYALVAKQNTRFKGELVELWQDKKALLRMLLASFLIAANWLIYIYAVGHGQATQASLGYYIMPIVSILFALIFLRESLSRSMWAAVLLAFIGVLVLVANTGKLPVSLGLALSFGFYGLIKKGVRLSSDVAMLVESGLLLPFVAIYLVFFSPESFSSYSSMEMFLLAISGVVTAVPLLCFSEAVKRAPLNLIGFIQYLNPTIQLLVAILIFGETVSFGELKGFLFIWMAILVFVTGQIVTFRRSS